MKLKVYANKTNKWIKRKTLSGDTGCNELYDIIDNYNEKYGMRHFLLPADIEPSNYPELDRMEEIALSHIRHYHNDFYMWDTQMYFTYSRKGLWCLRHTGTNYIPIGESVSEDKRDILSEEKKDVYDYYLKSNDYFYFVNEGKIKRLSRTKAADLIEKELKKISQKTNKIA